ncbi:hypothetical protein Naga_102666g1 [Nannochloropsis gaditana]|uniref:Uncharacterized protein n=1 Tax=Nannochloropsis gaditana TaxID=72520 RepID=W7THM9_9STRA|nr:hypothetical protein Naga_102666g1 [Nannochloropsis gaditana]
MCPDCPTVPGAGLGIGTALGPPILLRAEGSGPSHGGGDGGGTGGTEGRRFEHALGPVGDGARQHQQHMGTAV